MALALGVRHRQTPAPDIALNLLGYTNRGSYLVAEMQVTNKGPGSVTYGAWGSIPYGWVKAQTAVGWTNDRMAPPFTGSILIVRPGSSAAFSLALPRGTLRWKCGFCVGTATVRERTAWRLFELGIFSRVDRIPICDRLLGLLLDLLSSKTKRSLDFESDLFEVGAPAAERIQLAESQTSKDWLPRIVLRVKNWVWVRPASTRSCVLASRGGDSGASE